MWQPLSTLPASNAGALSPYAQQQGQPTGQVPPVMTPGGGGGGAPLQGGDPMRGLHPMFRGMRMGGFGMGGPPWGGFGGMGARGPMDGTADPTAFQSAMQAWRGDMPQFDMSSFFPNGFRAGAAPGFDPNAFRQQVGDYRQQFMDWRQARPARADF